MPFSGSAALVPQFGNGPNAINEARLRTALVLVGSGTAGAYHAGVLRALHDGPKPPKRSSSGATVDSGGRAPTASP